MLFVGKMQYSKLQKVMRRIRDLKHGVIPFDDQYKFRERAGRCIDAWDSLFLETGAAALVSVTSVMINSEASGTGDTSVFEGKPGISDMVSEMNEEMNASTPSEPLEQ